MTLFDSEPFFEEPFALCEAAAEISGADLVESDIDYAFGGGGSKSGDWLGGAEITICATLSTLEETTGLRSTFAANTTPAQVVEF
jgi:hypothetical protein